MNGAVDIPLNQEVIDTLNIFIFPCVSGAKDSTDLRQVSFLSSNFICHLLQWCSHQSIQLLLLGR